MSADLLREAAALMRTRAEDATPGPWRKRRGMGGERVESVTDDVFVAEAYSRVDMRHIASWHPTVALVVANWLEGCAERVDITSQVRLDLDHEERDWYLPALAVATAYLGTAS